MMKKVTEDTTIKPTAMMLPMIINDLDFIFEVPIDNSCYQLHEWHFGILF